MKSSSAGRGLELGRSISVPIVQKLAEGGEVPERYIRPELESGSADTSAGGVDLPAIDLKKLLERGEELSKLGFACREWGFFQLTNHGIPERVMERVKEDVAGFFDLPLEEKQKAKQMPGHLEGYGQIFVHSEQQKLDWADTLILSILPTESRDLRVWPAKPPNFRVSLEAYATEIRRVGDSIIESMAVDLGVDSKKMLEIFSGKLQSVRINYYPPCREAEKVIGLSPHSDGSALSLLLQVNDVQGLQIKKNGDWLLVRPIPGSLIVNIGDVLEIMTNGVYKSIEHRAVVNARAERLSIAAFQFPDLHQLLRPFPELVGERGELYRALTLEEYTRVYFAGKLNGKNTLESMKLKI